MLVTPPFGASSNIALWRAYSKPPVELVVADLDKNIETIIMAMEEASENMQIFYCCQNVLLQNMICLCHTKKVLQMMI